MPDSLATEAQHSRTAEAELRSQFHAAERQMRERNYQFAALLAIFLVLAGAPLDFVFESETGRPNLATLFISARGVCAVMLGGLYLMMRLWKFTSFLPVCGHLIALLPQGMLLWIITVSDGVKSPYYAGLNLVMVGAVLLLRWPLVHSLINALMCLAGFVVVALPGSDNARLFFNSFYYLVATAVIVVAGAYWLHRQRFLEFQLRDRLQRSQRQTEENHKKLLALDQAKTHFFSNVSHELRTPLTLILSPLDQLRRSPGLSREPKTLQLVAMLEENGLRLLRHINELLELGRMESEPKPELSQRTNIRDFVGSIVGALRATAETRNITLHHLFESDCGDDHWINLNRFERIIFNLGINAVKFTPRGGRIGIDVTIKDHQLRLVVSDTGPGIPPEHLKLIFERFYQADLSSRRQYGGVGIGLALVKAWTQSLGGTSEVDSTPGVGTTFTITLPLEEGDPSVVTVEADKNVAPNSFEDLDRRALLGGVAESEEAQPAESAEADPLGAMPLLALIAEDEGHMRRYLAGVFDGFKAIQAKDGKEAWNMALQHKPDVIVLDYMMPGLNGLEVTKRLRENPSTSRVPILMITADLSEERRLEALKLGVNDFLTKPFFTIELIARARNLVKNRLFESDLVVSKQSLEIAHETLEYTAARLIHSERLSALGRLSAGIIHEVNNPLNYTRTALHALKDFSDQITEDDRADFLEVVGDANEGVERVIGTMNELRAYTRGNTSEMKEVSLHAVVQSSRRLIKSYLSGIEMLVDVPEDLIVYGNEIQLSQVFMNLMQNAASFVRVAEERGEKPQIQVVARRDDSGSVIVKVRDNGSGIAQQHLAQVFDPFFSHRDAGDGAGLGLCITHQIMITHGGKVEVESEQGKYTEFSLCFPPLDSIIKADSEKLESL